LDFAVRVAGAAAAGLAAAGAVVVAGAVIAGLAAGVAGVAGVVCAPANDIVIRSRPAAPERIVKCFMMNLAAVAPAPADPVKG
jgi:hypothetical protein